ncbi:Senescence domain-containing protein [Plasmodiophora brassicae]
MRLPIGVATLLAVRDTGVYQVCAPGAFQLEQDERPRDDGGRQDGALRLVWADGTLRLPGKCLVIDADDDMLVAFDSDSDQCHIVHVDGDTLDADAFEVLVNVIRQACTFVPRDQCPQGLISKPLVIVPATTVELAERGDAAAPVPARSSLATSIEQGAGTITRGIKRCSSLISGSLLLGSAAVQSRIAPSRSQLPVHPAVRDTVHAASTAATAVATTCHSVVEAFSSAVSGPEPSTVSQSALSQVVRSSVRGACQVGLACSDASLEIVHSAYRAGTDILAHKYGEQVGQVLRDGSDVLMGSRVVAQTIRRLCLQTLLSTVVVDEQGPNHNVTGQR